MRDIKFKDVQSYIRSALEDIFTKRDADGFKIRGLLVENFELLPYFIFASTSSGIICTKYRQDDFYSPASHRQWVNTDYFVGAVMENKETKLFRLSDICPDIFREVFGCDTPFQSIH